VTARNLRGRGSDREEKSGALRITLWGFRGNIKSIIAGTKLKIHNFFCCNTDNREDKNLHKQKSISSVSLVVQCKHINKATEHKLWKPNNHISDTYKYL